MKLLLFSGGLDSTALAHWLRPDRLLFIDYGQKSAAGEMAAAQQIASELKLEIDIRVANCRTFGAGEMADGPVLSSEAPEFWPYRNQLLLTLAAMAYAIEHPLSIIIGTVKTDRVHPDGRPAFLSRMRSVLRAQGDVLLEAPAINMTSNELQETAAVPFEILAWSFSCHRGNRACGQCRGCHKHYETLARREQMTR
jgi:7-cyano-7-deazaguanine synthase